MRPVYEIYKVDSDIQLLDIEADNNRRNGLIAGAIFTYLAFGGNRNDDNRSSRRHAYSLIASFIAAGTALASAIQDEKLQNYRQDLVDYQNFLINRVNAPSV